MISNKLSIYTIFHILNFPKKKRLDAKYAIDTRNKIKKFQVFASGKNKELFVDWIGGENKLQYFTQSGHMAKLGESTF